MINTNDITRRYDVIVESLVDRLCMFTDVIIIHYFIRSSLFYLYIYITF